ncbi:12315_t:CDS:1, partial [Gigaspora margarita]
VSPQLEPFKKSYQTIRNANLSKTISSNIKQWISLCSKKQTDPITCPLNNIIEFFEDQIKKEKAYNTIAGYRLAISEIHDWINLLPVSSHLTFITAMKSVYNTNLPNSQDDNMVDLTPAFDKIRSFGDNNTMSISCLLQKVAFLLAITTASRPSDLARIDFSSCKLMDNGVLLTIKNSKKYKISLSHSRNKLYTKQIYVEDYTELPDIFSIMAVNVLLKYTESWRKTIEQKSCLLLTSTSNYKPLASSTIANWIKEILIEAFSNLRAKDTQVLVAFYVQTS